MKEYENPIEEILPGLFRIEVPLPGSPLKSINSYVIAGGDRFLVIDTGMNRDECLQVFHSAFKELGVDLGRTDFFITHFHVDHIGLASTLARGDREIYLNPVESAVVATFGPDRWNKYREIFIPNGFPELELDNAIRGGPGFSYGIGPKRARPFASVSDNDVLKIGDYELTVIYTPGHSPCHSCLYDRRKKILFSGDHILFDITPNIAYWPEINNSLGYYLESLEKVYNLDVNLVLPGHRGWQTDLKPRVDELRAHHNKRLAEALDALRDGEKTAYQVAPHLHWEIESATWDKFPLVQKYFAVGETIAHLHYLNSVNKIKQRLLDGKIYYSIA